MDVKFYVTSLILLVLISATIFAATRREDRSGLAIFMGFMAFCTLITLSRMVS